MKVYAWKFTDIQKLDQPLLAPYTTEEANGK